MKELDYFLDDSDTAGGQAVARRFSEQLRIYAWNWAQEVLSLHTARERSAGISIESDERSAPIPLDCMEIAQVYDPGNTLLYSPMKFHHGGYRDDDTDDYTFWVWGRILYFGRAVKSTEELTLFYYADWPDVEYKEVDSIVSITQPEILVPSWSMLALMHLSAATILQPSAIAAAMSNEYKIKIDSGTPLDNPREQQARTHLMWYNDLVGKQAPQPRIATIPV